LKRAKEAAATGGGNLILIFMNIYETYINYYLPPMESGGGYSFGVVLPSVHPNFVSGLVLCNYWLEFNQTLWESSISRGDAHIIGLFRSDNLTQSYGP
jgi:hypothetical protein